MIISKAASFPFPAQQGENNCSSQGLKGPISPSPGGSQAFPKHFRAPHPTGAGGARLLLAAPSSSSAPAKERSRSRAGLSLCLRPSRSSPAAPCPPWTASLRLSGSTKGTLHAGAAHWQRTHGCVRGQECTHN